MQVKSTVAITRIAARAGIGVVLSAALAGFGAFAGVRDQAEDQSREHSESPDPPAVIQPGASNADPPSDAIVLFDGTDFANWRHPGGEAVEWSIDDEARAMTITPGAGPIVTKREFGAAQIHIEFATPEPAEGDKGQNRGNSGVYVQARYEVQVLDSFENETYPDGQCGAVYGQHPPLVNASRPPGAWQTFDIIFRPAVLNEVDARVRPATMTVFHNGVLIHDHVEVKGPTVASMRGDEEGRGPLYLQDHGHAVRYRNIWIRPLSQ